MKHRKIQKMHKETLKVLTLTFNSGKVRVEIATAFILEFKFEDSVNFPLT